MTPAFPQPRKAASSSPPSPPVGAEGQLPAIVLAAGLSSRMGDFKPLLPLHGKPLIRHVLDALRCSQAISTIYVVAGHHYEELKAALSPYAIEKEFLVLFNPNYAQGEMLSSLIAGIDALSPEAPGFLLALADQPAVLPQTIARLVAAFHSPAAANSLQSSPPPLVLPTSLGKRGHPVVISTLLVPEIRSLSPGASLKTVVHRHLARARLLPVDDPSIHDDLDTPADFARAQASVAPVPPIQQ